MRHTICAFLLFVPVVTSLGQDGAIPSRLSGNPSASVSSLGNGLIRISDIRSGNSRVKNISDYGTYIASGTGLVVDMGTIDTSMYSPKYHFWREVPLNNSSMCPLAVGDQNHNGRKEIIGGNLEWTDPPGSAAKPQIYELNADSGFTLSYTYPDLGRRGIAVIDNPVSTSSQVFLLFMGRLENYTYSGATSLCTNLNYVYNPGQNVPTQLNTPILVDLDHDRNEDLVYYYMGSMPGDTAPSLPGHDTIGYANSCHIAEYDSAAGNFVLRYHWRFAPNDMTSGWGFATGDFDMDGKMEIATGTVHGVVHVVKCDSNDSYHYAWSGNVETYNAWLALGTHDIDHNGKNEFWIGGDAYYNGVATTRITCFESTGAGQYAEVYRIDIIGIVSFFAGNMVAADVDKDGTDELIVCIDQTVLIFKSVEIGQYKLFYLKTNELADQNSVYYGVTASDLDGDGIPEMLISAAEVNPSGTGLRFRTRIYQHSFSTSIPIEPKQIPKTFSLFQNYPNPFNPSTTIRFSIPERSRVRVAIFNLLGQQVAELANQEMAAGNFERTWNANVASGMYFCRLEAISVSDPGRRFVDVKKMVVMK